MHETQDMLKVAARSSEEEADLPPSRGWLVAVVHVADLMAHIDGMVVKGMA